MNKRIAKKKDFAAFINFINDVNIDEDSKNSAENIAIDIWCEDHPENPDLTDDDFATVDFIAWQVYKDILKDDRNLERIINLGKRKVQILLDSSGPNIWLLDWERYGDGDKASVLDQLSPDEQAKIVFHKHFHNY